MKKILLLRRKDTTYEVQRYYFHVTSHRFTILSYMFTILSYVFRNLSYVFLISFYVFSMPNLRVLEADSLQNLQVLDAWLMGCFIVDSVEYLIVRWF